MTNSARMGTGLNGAGKIRLPIGLLGALLALLLGFNATATAQPGSGWRLVADGEALAWESGLSGSPNPAEAAARALAHLQQEGYVLSRIDSASTEPVPTLFATRGPKARVAEVSFTGITSLDETAFAETMATQPRRPYDRQALERDLDALLVQYERLGLPLAQARPSITLEEAGAPSLAIRITVVEGTPMRLAGFEFEGDVQTRPAFVARIVGLRVGEPLVPYNPEAIRRDLEDTGLFEEVGLPELVVADSGAVVRVPVQEGPPGTFDLVLGYLPAANGRDGTLVGNGLLELRNLFGGGRLLRLRLVRDPGLVSSVDVRVADPFIFGWPFRLEGRFAGYTQDSTFARQQFLVEGGYRVVPGLELIVAASREAVEPGFFGAQLVNGRPRVAASQSVFGGVGLRYRQLDMAVNPRRGLLVEALVEQGFARRQLPLADSGAVIEPVTVQQQRLVASGRLFVPTLRRQVLVTGGDASVLVGGRATGNETSTRYDEGDLFRIGGATTLRGYDENRFVGTVTARALAEYRYQLDRTSFAFLFVDVGYVDRPALPDTEPLREVLPGYGFGIQYQTPLGLVTVTYALNPDLGVGQGKVHAGLSFGL